METRVAVISIIVEDREAAATLNTVLHDYGDEIIGRMGLPYPKKKINIISVAVDAALKGFRNCRMPSPPSPGSKPKQSARICKLHRCKQPSLREGCLHLYFFRKDRFLQRQTRSG